MMSLWATATPLLAQERTTAESTPARQATGPATGPTIRPAIVIDAERNFYDLRSGVTRFEDNVSITRGAMEVQADRGIIRQAEGQITEVELEGQPSTWRDRLEDGSVVTGEARMIHFDVIANIVTLTGNAIIRHEQGEFTGDELVYDLTAESLAGRSTGNERVRVVIEPDAMSDPRPAPAPNGGEPESEQDAEGGAEGPAASNADTGEETAEPPGTGSTDPEASGVESAAPDSSDPASTDPQSIDSEPSDSESPDATDDDVEDDSDGEGGGNEPDSDGR
ncbi:lipopolysaccharide transport periplasmic protein LptA [Halomonas denitrificans]|nr:lipopolysaccharide transport periplasmic protein LptA [Halomonas denitrificans]